MIIIVTGTPGTGKTTFAKKIAEEKGYEYVDVNKIIEEKKIYDKFDKDMQTYIVDTDKLNEVLLDIIGKHDVVIDSHLSHYLPADKVDMCYVTKCSLPQLKRRLEKRGYSEEKVRENLDAEIFDVCRIEAVEAGHDVTVIDTTETPAAS